MSTKSKLKMKTKTNRKKTTDSLAKRSSSKSKPNLAELQDLITAAFANPKLTPQQTKAVQSTIQLVDVGALRVCTLESGTWTTHDWVKKAILLYFRVQKMKVIRAGDLKFYDKIPVKNWREKDGVRVVPHAVVRYGSFVASGAILMPSYVNIGAYIDTGTLVDTWATVGSCAQVGKNVHISGGVGLGGVLEPVQASPVIIEDDVFIGSRSIIVEGVHVKKGAVIGAGVTLTASSKIIDVSGANPIELKAVIPENSVVIPGSLAKAFEAGQYNVNCALIIGKRKESTDKKTSLNQVLRDFNLSP